MQVYTHVTGVPRPSAHNAAPTPESSLRGHRSQNRVGSDVASPATVRPWVDGPGAGDDGPPAAGEGGHVACAPAAGRVSDLQAPARDNHRGQGMVSVLLLLNVFLHITVCPVALNDLFAFLNILYCPRL